MPCSSISRKKILSRVSSARDSAGSFSSALFLCGMSRPREFSAEFVEKKWNGGRILSQIRCEQRVGITWESSGRLWKEFRARDSGILEAAEFSKQSQKIPPRPGGLSCAQACLGKSFSTNPQRSSQQQAFLFSLVREDSCNASCCCANFHSGMAASQPPFPQVFSGLCPLYLARKRVQYASGTSEPEKT
jgi:hypothetical protein